MRRSNIWLVFAMILTGCSFDAQAPREEQVSRQRIVNGRMIVDPAEVVKSNAVVISREEPDGTITDMGSGVLIGSKVVLTASHVAAGNPDAVLRVRQGNAPNQVTVPVEVTRPHPGFTRREPTDPTGFSTSMVDVALLHLDAGLAPDVVPFPNLVCSEVEVDKINVISGYHHTKVQRIPRKLGFLVTPTSGVTTQREFGQIRATENEIRFHLPQFQLLIGIETSTAPGDSGSGIYVPDSTDLLAIYTDEHRSVVPAQKLPNGEFVSVPNATTDTFPNGDIRGRPDYGYSYRLSKICDWIKVLKSSPLVIATQQHLDDSGVPGVVAMTPVGQGEFALSTESPEVGKQSLDLSIPDLPASAAPEGIALGQYGGGKAGLVVLEDGALFGASIEGGPEAELIDAPTASYVTIQKARIDGNTRDDLVAQRADGTIDVFLGTPQGALDFDPTIKVVPTRFDNDPIQDFVWVDGQSGIHVSSSLNGHFFRDVVPNTIDLDVADTGVFRRLAGENADVEDIVVLGDGIVIWCRQTGFGGFNCENGTLDAPFMSNRTATAIDVRDHDGDQLDDITISYAGEHPNRILFGRPAGFPAAAIQGRAFANTRQGARRGKVIFSDEGGNVNVTFIDEDDQEFGPFNLGMVFGFVFKVLTGNLNDDGEVPNALVEGAIPFEDLVVLNGDTVFTLTSNQDGTFLLEELDDATGVVDIELTDVNNDGIDDIEATKDDGSVSVYAGGPTGVDPVARNFTGLPTPNSDDGKMLILSGLGVDTVGATEARLRLRVGPEDATALDDLKVEIFDGNNGGLDQFDEETHSLKTCYRLSADPCGDGNAGNCNGGPIAPIHLTTVSSDSLGDAVWDTIFEGPHALEASLAGDGQPPFTYELRVFMSQNCSQLPSPGSTISVTTADAFKVRSNAMLSQPLGEFSFVGSDSNGPFAVRDLPYLRDTFYDGQFSLPIAVGSSATEIQLKESDADDTDDSTEGVSLGASSAIQFRLLTPNGTDALVVGEEDGGGTTLVTNPSGNNDGATNLDVETRVHTITTPAPGTWTWQWENVLAANAVHVFAPFGSPTTHEILGAYRPRPVTTTAQQPAFWQGDSAAVLDQLPVLLGNELTVSTLDQAQTVLSNLPQTLFGELERQQLTAKLNVTRSLVLGEHLEAALVYGRTISVRTVLQRADDVVSGVNFLASKQDVEGLVSLLSSINLGEVNYQYPGVPFPDKPMADDDADGIINLKDNCPPIANPLQEDSDDNRIGDACQVQPSACVLERLDGSLEAYFSYDNPLIFRAFATGPRNQLLLNDTEWLDAGQPTELSSGLVTNAFNRALPIGEGDTLVWTLDGATALASADAAPCSGRELARLPFAPQAVLYGAEEVILGDYTSVTAPEHLSSVVSGGDLVIGASSVVGHAVAGARATIAEHGLVMGTAVARDGFTKASTASVGAIKALAAPSHVLEWVVDFGTVLHDDVTVRPRERQLLAPGDYGNVVVSAQAELVLQPGNYRFRSLRVDERSSLQITGGDVVLHVAAGLELLGETDVEADASLFVGYFGSNSATIASSLHATVVAPQATLTLGTLRNSVYSGAFYGRRVDVRPSSLVQFRER